MPIRKENVNNENKLATILDFDKVFGLGLDKIEQEKIPEEIINIADERKLARDNKDWAKSDELRNKIKDLGYDIKDTESGYKINKI